MSSALLTRDFPMRRCRPTHPRRRMSGTPYVLARVLAALMIAGACSDDVPPPPEATSDSPAAAPATERVVGPLSPEDAAALATMNDRLKAYVELHKKLEGELPKLPDDATPQQIDKHQ